MSDSPSRSRPDSPPRRGEHELVERATRGDASALEALLEEYGPAVRARLSIGPDRRRDLDADDVMQVTYLEAYLRIRGLRARTRAGFAAWLRRIAENNLADALRGLARGRRPDPARRVTQGGPGEGSRTLLERLAVSSTTAGGVVSDEEARGRLRASIARLPASYREVIEACDLEERPATDVAQERDCTAGAVYMLRSRAHDRLRELLSANPELFGDSP